MGAFDFITKRLTTQTVRPTVSTPMMSTDTGAKLPIFPFPMAMVVELAKSVDAVRIPIDTLNREMFKNGFEIKERFKYKCNDCAKEFEYPPKKSDSDTMNVDNTPNNTMQDIKDDSLMCDTCGGIDIIKPDPKNRKRLEELMTKPVNTNQQTLEEVSRQIEQDLEIFDMAFLLTSPKYDIDDKTGIAKIKEYTEYVRVDPPSIAFIVDADGRLGYTDTGAEVKICPDPAHRKENLMYVKDGAEARCNICDAVGVPAWFEVNTVYGLGVPTPKRVVYARDEILWKVGKYSPGMLYGYSPIYTIWSKAMSLSHMDEYIRKYFDKMRPPRGMLIMASRNYETFKKSWDVLQQKSMEDPYAIQPLLVEQDRGGSGKMAEWLDFTGSLKELEFTVIRRELRMIIGALYGVLPLYFGELPTGWSQEGLQVTITNRAVKWGQDILYKAFFRKIGDMLGIEDWDIKLKEGEETDKLRDLQIQGVEIENMKAYQELGFDVTRTATGEFIVSQNPVITLEDQFEAQNPDAGEEGQDTVLKPGGRGRGSAAPKEEQQRMQGAPSKKRPGTEGGHQGDPRGAGRGTGIRKTFPNGITPTNFEVVKTVLQSSLDYGWKKTKTVDELRSRTKMTVRHAREIVENELNQFERWDTDPVNKSEEEEE
jgi:DNA-directed RNA polymerase subunit RPC12/RpoP